MSSYFLPRPPFRMPRLVLRTSNNKVRREARNQSLVGFFILLVVVWGCAYGFLTSDSKWIQAGYSAIIAAVCVIYLKIQWETWVDDGRRDKFKT